MLQLSLVAAVETGGYISLIKVVPFLIVIVVWAKLLTWADKDAVYAHLPREQINAGLLGGMVVGAAAFFLIPFGFIVSFLALLLFFGIDIGVYLYMRNAKVGLKDLKGEMKEAFSFGKPKEKTVTEIPDQVSFLQGNGSPHVAPKAEDPLRATYDLLQASLSDPLRRNAEIVEVVPNGEGAVVRYIVDGVGYRAHEMDRNNAAGVIAMAKGYAAMDTKDRRKPQSGKVKVAVNGKKHDLVINTAGSSAGETMRIRVDQKKQHDFKPDTLGFTARQLKLIRETAAEGTGVVLVAAPKGQGLTSTLYGLIRAHDAFVEHIQSVEREPDQDLEGITQNAMPGTPPPGEESRMVDWVGSQQPEVMMVSPLEEPKSAQLLVEFAKEHRAYVGLRANGVTEALQMWRKLVGNDKAAYSQLRMVITGRVVRKLCNACKVAYSPDPATLRKLNMDPEKVTQLFQARSQPMRNEKGEVVPCTYCNELRFAGRVGVFEVLNVDDDVRAALLADSGSQLKAAFRKQKGRYLQEAALEVVERGDTSVQEVLRVLRGPDAKAKGSSPEAA
ncbi:MAG TPA: ATPase, T2SS/T4P/T4SS family [Tepidisphaeraceae bacterium]|jgi:general secretion pathway protein E|nr:ATPase, T2SS/T4P/T4SS family [Tepidisphaeraceae bacterium]